LIISVKINSGDDRAFEQLLDASARQDWVVYAKPPFSGPEKVLKYLARYTHRIAISNRRLVSINEQSVTFRWKDYAHGNRPRTMTLDGVEFLRRFLLHAVPNGFMRIRHFGNIGYLPQDPRIDDNVDLNQFGLDPKMYSWYRDFRRYGSVPHAGFGLGFERLVVYVCGLANIRDAIPYPRAPGSAEF